MIDLTTLFNAVIALLAAIITAFVIPWIKAKASVQQQEALAGVYRTLVYAAEQIYGSGHGQEKLKYVSDKLKAKGYTVDMDMIEATVHMHFGNWIPADPKRPEEEDPTEDEEPQTPLM